MLRTEYGNKARSSRPKGAGKGSLEQPPSAKLELDFHRREAQWKERGKENKNYRPLHGVSSEEYLIRRMDTMQWLLFSDQVT